MRGTSSNQNKLWLMAGLMLGTALSYVWPREAMHASVVDRDSQFAIATFSSGQGDPEGVFTLDFLTGDLRGAVIKPQLGKFSAFYYRNIIDDFGLDPSKKPKFAIAGGTANLTGRGGVTPASSLIYIAEQQSGLVIAYGFNYSSRVVPGAQPFVVVDRFPFRQAAEK